MPSSQPDLRCYYHPDREATGQCDRCGDYLCGQCTSSWAEQHLCPECLKRLDRPELAERGRKACVANLIGVAIFLFEATPTPTSQEVEDVDALLKVVVFGIAVVQAFRARYYADNAARKLLASIRLIAIAGAAAALASVHHALLAPVPHIYPEEPHLPVVMMAAGIVCLILPLMAVVRLIQADRAGVSPRWATILSFVSTFIMILLAIVILIDIVDDIISYMAA